MPEKQVYVTDAIGLSTKVEEDFISPLTGVRGALEILRDFDDLTDEQRLGFIDRALVGCKQLERGVEQLSDAVYAAALQPSEGQTVSLGAVEFTSRIHIHAEKAVVEIDFSDYEFRNSGMVNAFFDVIDRVIENEGGQRYFAFNQRDCRVWPEAWIAFAHRSKKVKIADSLGVVRFAEFPTGVAIEKSRHDLNDPMYFETRAAAFAAIEKMRA